MTIESGKSEGEIHEKKEVSEKVAHEVELGKKHFDDNLETELKAEKRNKSELTNYIKEHINSDLVMEPEITREVVKSLNIFLKASREYNKMDKEYMTLILVAINEIRRQLEGNTSRGVVYMHEIQKAAWLFPDLSEEQKKEIERYLDDKIEKQIDQTLEQYMKEHFKAEIGPIFDPDDAETTKGKADMFLFESAYMNNLEDFAINLPHDIEIEDKKIEELIEKYFFSQGYKIERDALTDKLDCIQGNKRLFVNYSNFSKFDHKILVSVVDISHFFK